MNVFGIIEREAKALEESRALHNFGYDERERMRGYVNTPVAQRDHTGHNFDYVVSGAAYRGCVDHPHVHCKTCSGHCVWPLSTAAYEEFRAAVEADNTEHAAKMTEVVEWAEGLGKDDR